MEWTFKTAPLERRHSLQESSTPLTEEHSRTPSLVSSCDLEEECRIARFFFDTTEGEVMKTVEIEGTLSCQEMISLLLEKFSPVLTAETNTCTDFQLIQLSHDVNKTKYPNFHRCLYTIHEPIYFEDTSISGEKVLSPGDQPFTDSNFVNKKHFNFLLKDRRKFDRKSNPSTPDSMLKLGSFFSTDYKSTTSSNFSLVSNMSSDSSSNTGGSTPMLDSAKPFSTPNNPRRSSLNTTVNQSKSNSLTRNKSYSKAKGNQLRKNISFGAIMRWKGKKKEFDDEFELPSPIRKFSTLPPGPIDEFDQSNLLIPIHICINKSTERKAAINNLPLTHDLTVDKALTRLLHMQGIDQNYHGLYGLYQVPVSNPETPTNSTSRAEKARTQAWGDEQAKRLDGRERLIALHTLSKSSPAVERRFELKKHSSVETTNKDGTFNLTYRAVNFGEDFYNDVNDEISIENECILDPPQLFSSDSSPTNTVTTEVEKAEISEFTSESNKEIREEEINNLLDLHRTPNEHPFLLSLRSNPLLTSLLIHLNDTVMYIGSEYQEGRLTDNSTFVLLQGSDIKPTHCRISFSSPFQNHSHLSMHIEPIADSNVLVNNKRVLFSTRVQPGDLIQLGDSFLFMYRNPSFEHNNPSYKLNWTAQLNESTPQSDVIQLQSTPKFILGESIVEKLNLESFSEPDFQNIRSVSMYSDDGFFSIGTLSPNEKKSMLFSLPNFDNLIEAVTKKFDISSEKGKLIPACMLAQGFDYFQKKDPSSAVNFFHSASTALAASIKNSVTKLSHIQAEFVFPSQALNIYESISREFESALLWISNGIEFTTYPTAYFSKQPSGENGMSEDMKRDTFALQTVIGDGVNETMNFFQKLLNTPLIGLIDENHVFLTLSPSSTCTETSGYISSSTSYNSRSSPAHKHNSGHNANVDVVNDLLQLFYKTLHDTYTSTELIPEIFTHLFARVKKFLANFLFEHGEELGLYSQTRGVQMRNSVRQVEQWANRTGLSQEYNSHESCLESILKLLSTNSDELVKLDWNALRKRFPILSPSQLHHILLHYILPGIPGLSGLPGSTSSDSIPAISLVITPEHWRPSITEADSAFNHAKLKERGFLPLPFTFPKQPYILVPDKVSSDIPFDQYVDKLLSTLKEKPSTSPEYYDSSSNTMSPEQDLDVDMDSSQDEYVTQRRFSSFDNIIGISDLESSFSSLIGRHNSVDYLVSSNEHGLYDDSDNEFSFASDHNLNNLLRSQPLDRPRSFDCLHRHTSSDSLVYHTGMSDIPVSRYQTGFFPSPNSPHKFLPLEHHQLKISHSPPVQKKDTELLDLLGSPEGSSESGSSESTPNTARKQLCKTTLSFEIKPYQTQSRVVNLTDEDSSESDDGVFLNSRFTKMDSPAVVSKIREINLVRNPNEDLGLELVRGDNTTENIPGIYIRSISQESTASKNPQLTNGSKILSINHQPLISTDLHRAKELLDSEKNILLRVLPCDRHFV